MGILQQVPYVVLALLEFIELQDVAMRPLDGLAVEKEAAVALVKEHLGVSLNFCIANDALHLLGLNKLFTLIDLILADAPHPDYLLLIELEGEVEIDCAGQSPAQPKMQN